MGKNSVHEFNSTWRGGIMALSQEIILYFEIIPLLSIILYIAVKSYMEDKKAVKTEIRKLKKANRVQREFIEKEIFLRGNI